MACDFKGKVALVTGASRGIGRAVAVELGRGGATVVMGWHADRGAADEAAALVEQAGGRPHLVQLDVADDTACRAAVDAVLEQHGALHVLVNNAGLARDGLLVRLKDDDWSRTLAVNLDGTMHLCRAVARPMMKQRGGAIVNVASVVAQTGNAGQAAYAAAKGGILAFTRSLARELAGRSIRVNAVSPGFIETDMTADLDEAALARLREVIPLGRPGAPAEVARAISWLASDDASYVTGHVLNVNGGMYM